ncbi:MAG: hypothetical protein JWR32_2687 [Mycobacterium sp.]|jgi:hypothetical protein|nr:hypothetical protein [Mycobacterium sp.]
MHLKHVVGASAIVVGMGLSPFGVGVGLANADPPCSGPNCQGPGGPNGPGAQGGSQQAPPGRQNGAPPNGAPPNDAQQNGAQQNGAPPNSAPQNGAQQNGAQQNGAPPNDRGQQGNAQPQNNQGPHDPTHGGPADLPQGTWKTVGQEGVPQPPGAGDRDHGWNDGQAPGHPPRDWDGPTPPGGWDGPPPVGGWNRSWDGPPRDIDQGRFDHQPFDYDDYYAKPVYDPGFNQWGFWFFGIWIPL